MTVDDDLVEVEDDDPHGGCIEPHIGPDGDYIDCDGRPV